MGLRPADAGLQAYSQDNTHLAFLFPAASSDLSRDTNSLIRDFFTCLCYKCFLQEWRWMRTLKGHCRTSSRTKEQSRVRVAHGW